MEQRVSITGVPHWSESQALEPLACSVIAKELPIEKHGLGGKTSVDPKSTNSHLTINYKTFS